MEYKTQQLLLLSGLWCSVVALTIGGALVLPRWGGEVSGMSAMLYALSGNTLVPPSAPVPATGKAIVADIGKMEITLYENGLKKTAYPILSKGREGTFWQTPVGTYSIKTKEPKHFSSIGNVWMPYSMQFYGNFFIHGWPKHTDGTSVPMGYSGGCIRLDTDDARAIYGFASIGTPVIVVGGRAPDLFATSTRYYFRSEGVAPEVTAGGIVIVDAETDALLWSRGEDTPAPPGNMTALMTALTALETVNQYKIVRISELLLGRPVLRNNRSVIDDEMSVGTLIYPLLFDGNDTAAKAFAKEHGTKQFVRTMNEKSTAIGMTDSMWSGPLSSDPGTTTARDLSRLISYVNTHKHFLIDASLSAERSIESDGGVTRYSWKNKNPWVISGDGRYRGGVADIRRDGGGSAALLFSLPLAEFENRTIAIALVDSSDVEGDVARILEYVTNFYVYGIEEMGGVLTENVLMDQPTVFKMMRELFIRKET